MQGTLAPYLLNCCCPAAMEKVTNDGVCWAGDWQEGLVGWVGAPGVIRHIFSLVLLVEQVQRVAGVKKQSHQRRQGKPGSSSLGNEA